MNRTLSFQETRRQAAAEAANRRLHQAENRGVDEDEYRRMKQRQTDRDRLDEQQRNYPHSSGSQNNTGLRVSVISLHSNIHRFISSGK